MQGLRQREAGIALAGLEMKVLLRVRTTLALMRLVYFQLI